MCLAGQPHFRISRLGVKPTVFAGGNRGLTPKRLLSEKTRVPIGPRLFPLQTRGDAHRGAGRERCFDKLHGSSPPLDESMVVYCGVFTAVL